MYKLQMSLLTGEINMIVRSTDGASIPFDPANRDYQEYQEWLAQGNTPEPPDEVVE